MICGLFRQGQVFINRLIWGQLVGIFVMQTDCSVILSEISPHECWYTKKRFLDQRGSPWRPISYVCETSITTERSIRRPRKLFHKVNC